MAGPRAAHRLHRRHRADRPRRARPASHGPARREQAEPQGARAGAASPVPSGVVRRRQGTAPAAVASTRACEQRMTDLRPMLAVPGRLPHADQDDRWAYEMKWDGVRMTANVSPTSVRLVGRSGIDATIAYPELQGLSGSLGGRTAVLDGEVAVLGPDGRSNFGALAPRMHVRSAARAAQLAATIPATYLVFDILAVDGLPTTSLPYVQRRELLEAVVAAGPNWQVSPSFVGGGPDLLGASRRLGLEGVRAKRLDSPYRPGQRSAEWIKIKNLAIQEVVIGGYTVGHGRREATFGALLLGLPAAGGLTYVGSVGTGFDDHLLDDIAE